MNLATRKTTIYWNNGILSMSSTSKKKKARKQKKNKQKEQLHLPKNLFADSKEKKYIKLDISMTFKKTNTNKVHFDISTLVWIPTLQPNQHFECSK